MPLLLTPPIVMQSAPADSVVELCKPALARKAGGEIASIDVGATSRRRATTTITGRLTAFQRMGPAPPGTARTHHVIRFDYTFECTVKAGRVRNAAVNLFRP